MKEKTFLLISGNGGTDRGWCLLIEEYDDDIVTFAAERFHDAMIHKMMYEVTRKDYSHLNVNNIREYLWQHISNMVDWLSEGKKLLVNRKGGIQFLDDNIIVLRKYYSYDFPSSGEEGMNGWLTPEGEFYPCAYGEHDIFAKENADKVEGKDLYIKMGSKGNDFNYEFSHLAIIYDPTDKQVEWSNKNFDNLDKKQQEILKKSNICLQNNNLMV